MIVTPDAPVNAVKSAHAASEIIASPPGSQPSSACDKATSRRGALPSLKRNPANVKSGMATSTGVSDRPKNSMPMTERSTLSLRKPAIALAAITAKSGAPSSVSTTSATATQTTSATRQCPQQAGRVAERDHAECDRYGQLRRPGRQTVEQHVLVSVGVADERERIPGEQAAHGERERLGGGPRGALPARREPARERRHRDVPA